MTWGAVPSTRAAFSRGSTTPSRESGSPEHRMYSAVSPAWAAWAATWRMRVDLPQPGPPLIM